MDETKIIWILVGIIVVLFLVISFLWPRQKNKPAAARRQARRPQQQPRHTTTPTESDPNEKNEGYSTPKTVDLEGGTCPTCGSKKAVLTSYRRQPEAPIYMMALHCKKCSGPIDMRLLFKTRD